MYTNFEAILKFYNSEHIANRFSRLMSRLEDDIKQKPFQTK